MEVTSDQRLFNFLVLQLPLAPSGIPSSRLRREQLVIQQESNWWLGYLSLILFSMSIPAQPRLSYVGSSTSSTILLIMTINVTFLKSYKCSETQILNRSGTSRI